MNRDRDVDRPTLGRGGQRSCDGTGPETGLEMEAK